MIPLENDQHYVLRYDLEAEVSSMPNRAYYEKHKERLKRLERERYARLRRDPGFRRKRKAERERLHFGVPRSVIFRRTKGRCVLCGRKAQLLHHLDWDGRTNEAQSLPPGRDPSRLVPMCRACHLDIHRDQLMLRKKTKANGYWSRDYPACIECGTVIRRHQGHGLCVNCYARASRRR